MHLAFPLRQLPAAVLAALVTLACGPKAVGDDTGTSDSSTGGGSNGTGAADTQECTPGDVMADGSGDCSSCVCSDGGIWQCTRCAPTTGLDTTTTTSPPSTDTDDATTTGPDTTDTASTTDHGTSSTGDTGGSEALPFCGDLPQGDVFDINAAQIVDDTLVLEVGYGGGCETHDFTLCFEEIIFDLVRLGVHHDAHGDACEAFITEEQKLDLTPTQNLGSSPLEIQLTGWDEPLQYDF